MSNIEIPHYLLQKLTAGQTGSHDLVDVELHDGRMFANIVVKHRRYLTGWKADPDGVGSLPFSHADVCDIEQSAFVLSHCFKPTGALAYPFPLTRIRKVER